MTTQKVAVVNERSRGSTKKLTEVHRWSNGCTESGQYLMGRPMAA